MRCCFTLLLTAFEALPLFGVQYPYFCSVEANPAVNVLIALELFSLAAVFALPEIWTGMRALFKGTGNPAAISAYAVLLSFVCTLVTAFSGGTSCLTPAALIVTAATISAGRRIKRDVLSFRVASGKRMKYVLDRYEIEQGGREEAKLSEYLPENPTMLKINKADFIEDFTENASKRTANAKMTSAFLAASALLFVAALAIGLIIQKNGGLAVATAYKICITSLPLSAFAALTVPSFVAAKRAKRIDSAEIGEGNAEACSEASVVSFDDTEVYPPYAIKLKKIKLYENSRIDHVLFSMTSLFGKTGGPLYDVLKAAASDIGQTDDVRINLATENGIDALVGTEHVLVGNKLYMEQEQFIPVYTKDDELAESNNEYRIMYFAAGGKIRGKFYLRYTMDADFVDIIKTLSSSGRCVAVRTMDPNIDVTLLSADIDVSSYPVTVLHCDVPEDKVQKKQSSSSPVISVSSPKELLTALTYSDKMCKGFKTGLLISFLCFAIGIILSLAAAFADMQGSIAPLFIAAYQAAFAIAVHITSRL